MLREIQLIFNILMIEIMVSGPWTQDYTDDNFKDHHVVSIIKVKVQLILHLCSAMFAK